MTNAGSSDRQTRLWPVTVSAAVAFAILLGLGTWQVQRLHWKEGLIATIDERIASSPAALADIEQRYSKTGDVDYYPVSVSGTFEHDGEQFFFATHNGQSGYYVYAPLRLADGRAVLVNRGFVPFDRKVSASRAAGQVRGLVTVTGLARNPLAAKPSWAVPDNDPVANIFYWKDRDAMAANAGVDEQELLPFFVDADATPNPGGLPVGGVTIVSLPNNHLQYAVTWYGLAAALAAVFIVWSWKRRA